jgi:maltooligosyltrehalose trehalohydrolase
MRDVPPAIRGARAFRTLGSVYDGGATDFRVWAPECTSVELVVFPGAAPLRGTVGDAVNPDGSIRPLTRDGGGYWAGRFSDIAPGTRYKLRLDGDGARTFPDPASRFQPEGVHGPSEVVDAGRFSWNHDRSTLPPLEHFVIYELHVGTFSPDGTFRGAIELIPQLVELGINAIELMPVGDFPGDRNWGYDGVAIFAPARCYGPPDDLRALVDAAHRLGVAVLLDVVYNHLGPDGAYANAFSPHYFTDAHRSPWGRGVNLDGPHSGAVRRFFLENALHWIDEYHVDGLRLDATHALHDDGPRHFLAELSDTVRTAAQRPVALIAEDHRNLARMLMPVGSGGFGLDAVWADDFHHQVRVHTACDREGYYSDFTGSMADVATTLRQGWFFTGQRSAHMEGPRGTDPSRLNPGQFVICTQNHDQIGNRADGARLHHEIDPAAYRAVTALLLLAPQTPLLFMGQEWAASSPFQFFTDHEEELGRKVTEGRREEFKSFAAFADPVRRAAIPDPQQRDTFERSRLQWSEVTRQPHAGFRRLHHRLLRLRLGSRALLERTRDTFEVRALDDHTIAIAYGPQGQDGPATPTRRDGGLLLVARLSGGAGSVRIPAGGPCDLLLATEDADVVVGGLPPVIERSASGHGHSMLRIDFRRPGAAAFDACFAHALRR